MVEPESASPRAPKRPSFYGRATILDGRRAPIRPTDRAAYEDSTKRLVEAAQAGKRR